MSKPELDIKHELGRKAVHLTSVIIILLYYWTGKEFTLYFLTAVLVIFIAVEYFRVEHRKKIPVFWRFFRPKEDGVMGGNATFMMGAIIAISVFDKEIASAAILMTTFGDMAAAIFGKAFGKTWIPGLKDRAVEGCAAEFLVNVIVGIVFLDSIMVIMVMALVATIVETLIYKLDDNLIIPIFAGAFGQVALYVF